MFPELLLYSIMVYLLILISSINTWDITSWLEIICIKHTNENLYIHSVKSIYARTWLLWKMKGCAEWMKSLFVSCDVE